VMCSEESEDSHRFADLVDAAIETEEVKSTAVYQKWAKDIRKRKAPKDPLGARREKKGGKSKKGEDAADLVALIQRKNAMRADQADAMFADLEAKYAKPKKAKK
jgi:DnaJ homolog subfamily C member 9